MITTRLVRRKVSALAEMGEGALLRRHRTRGYAELAKRAEHGSIQSRVYFFHVRKTGGTSLARAFLALGGEEPERVHWRMKRPPHATTSGVYVFVGSDRRLLEEGQYFFGWSHAPAWWLRVPPGTFRVTVLRDPVQRVISLYRYLADPLSDDGQPFPAPAVEREWARNGFGRFLDRVHRQDLLVQLYTFSQSFDIGEAYGRITGCDEVIFTPALTAATRHLGERLGVPLAPRRERRSVFREELTDREIARLREMLEPEYQLMNRLSEHGIVKNSGEGRLQDP